MIKRTETRKIFVGGVQIGGQNKVVIQSMTNTKTKDVDKTVNQIFPTLVNSSIQNRFRSGKSS